MKRTILPLRIPRPRILAFYYSAAAFWLLGSEVEADPGYVRDVRPILASACFACHGQDETAREADLRLDTAESAWADRGGYAAIRPGDPDQSAVIERITSPDADLQMPPPDSGKSLTTEQIAILRTWIEKGAKYEQHWSFASPRRPAVPQIEAAAWIHNPIDAFVLARLRAEGLSPAPRADRVTLLRRVSLDLIGLPPTIEDVDRFLPRDRRDAYAQEVTRLLQSPHFGEKWGRHWLDAARYADSDGFEKDKPREVWFYRDWVVKALNNDLPYDRFLIEQIAGDLLPGATQDQIVATGFLRNSMINEEGGIDPEQFRMEAMFDRMDAIGTALLGLTIQCAQCHDHKFDPLTQVDYYRMFAFLNNCHEAAVTVYTEEQQQQREGIFQQIAELEQALQAEHPDWRQRLAAWERERSASGYACWRTVRPELDGSGGQKHYLLDDGSILARGYAPTKHATEFVVDVPLSKITGFRLELLNDPRLPHGGPGRSIYGLCALTEFDVVAAPLDDLSKPRKLTFAGATAQVNPPDTELESIFDDKSDKRRITGRIEYAIDGDHLTAWGIDLGPGRSNVPRSAVFALDEPLQNAEGFRITFKLVQQHGGWNSDDNQNNNLGRFRFSVTSDPEPRVDPTPPTARDILALPADKRTEGQLATLFSYWRKTVPEWRETNERIEALWRAHPRGFSQLVLAERDEPRVTHRLRRGEFLRPAETVAAGVPAFLHGLPEARSEARLDFARWLADPGSPTVARAIVNRIWQEYFGIGLVATSEDLGTQGELPSHPKLLDWLAVELMDNGWRLKHIHRLIVESATYQQSSRVSPAQFTRDPENRLLARGPRFRVDAEIVRDVALAASGLLNRQLGGPSVYPPAPEFLFRPPASYGPKTWNYEDGPQKYRRGLYTFRFRSVPYPVMQNFDAPRGETSCVRRNQSNTPLQALTTLNEELFVDCARSLALRTVWDGGDSDRDRLTYAFRRCVARNPQRREAELLLKMYLQQVKRFANDEEQAWQLAAIDAKNPPTLPEGVTSAELAAWTAVSRVILNLDETLTKE